MDSTHRLCIRLAANGEVLLPTFTAREDVGDGTAWVNVPASDAPGVNESRDAWGVRLAARYGAGRPYPPDCLDHDPLPLLVREGGRMLLVAHGEARGRAARRAAEAKAAADALAAFQATA